MKKIIFIIKFFLRNAKFGKKGKNVRIIKPLFINGKRNMFFEDNVRFFFNARLETIEEWQNIVYFPKLCIGENTSFEQNCHIVAADELKIGKNCVFSAYVYVSDCGHGLDFKTEIMRTPLVVKKTSIGDCCFIGIGAKILPGVNLGNYCVVGANSVVTKSFPDYSMIAGSPAKIIKKYDPLKKEWKCI